MSVIQQIQEKYAKLMAIIIAVALIIFVIMLAFENGGSLFRGDNSNMVGKVNGKEITFLQFTKKVDRQEDYMKSQGYGSGEEVRQQALQQTWEQEVSRLLIESETDKLGMQIGKREMGDILYGANPPQDLRQQFTNQQTGQYDAVAAKQQLDQILKKGTREQKIQLNDYITQLELIRLNEKYNSLLSNSINIPKWLVEKQNADNSQLARISFISESYDSIPDKGITVSNKEIEDYISRHKADFKQEESRSIAYVLFSALPTAADSVAAREKLLTFKPEFDSTRDVKQFLETQGMQNYYNGYINGERIQVPVKDSIFRLPVNGVYGPYPDGGFYTLAKLVGVRTQADTVNIRHILIGTVKQDPQTRQTYPIRDSATAYKLADSIRIAISRGSSFDSLCAQFSDDDGSKSKGGVYEKVVSGSMVPEFNDFIFGHPAGSKDIVNTQFGAHYIEILSQKGSSPAYQVAYLSQPVEASDQTENDASNEAASFAGSSHDQKSFDANAEKLKAKGITKLLALDIVPTAYRIDGLGTSRTFIKSIYAAKAGEILQPERVGDNWVVAIVTEVNKKGTMSLAKAKPLVEPLLIKQKKAELLRKKLGAATTLEAAAAAWGGKAIHTADSLRFDGRQMAAVSSEPKVIGAAFNPANRGKLTPVIEGASAVYVIRVDNVSATPVIDANVAEQRKMQQQQARMMQQQMQMQGRGDPVINALREAATIKDNRSKVF
jgi:peptidyl-prolyl cis-trans isomerase D